MLNVVSLLAIGLAGHGSPAMAVSWHALSPAAWVIITMNFFLVNAVAAVWGVLATLERIARRESCH